MGEVGFLADCIAALEGSSCRQRHQAYTDLSKHAAASDTVFDAIFSCLTIEHVCSTLKDFRNVDRGLRVSASRFFTACLRWSVSKAAATDDRSTPLKPYIFQDAVLEVAPVPSSVPGQSQSTLYIARAGKVYDQLEQAWRDDGPCTTQTAHFRSTIRAAVTRHPQYASRDRFEGGSNVDIWGLVFDKDSEILGVIDCVDPGMALVGVEMIGPESSVSARAPALSLHQVSSHMSPSGAAETAVRQHTSNLARLQRKLQMIDREMEECPRKKQKMRLTRLRKETIEQMRVANDALKQSGHTKLAIQTCKETLREKAARLVQHKRASKHRNELVQKKKYAIQVQAEMKRAQIEREQTRKTDRHRSALHRVKEGTAFSRGWKGMESFFAEQVQNNFRDLTEMVEDKNEAILTNIEESHLSAARKRQHANSGRLQKLAKISQAREHKLEELRIRKIMEDVDLLSSHMSQQSLSTVSSSSKRLMRHESEKGISPRDLRQAYGDLVRSRLHLKEHSHSRAPGTTDSKDDSPNEHWKEDNILHVVRAAIDQKRSLHGHTFHSTRILFESMDSDQNGFLSQEEMYVALWRLDLGLSRTEIDVLMHYMHFEENHGDDKISYGEFAKALHGHRHFEKPQASKMVPSHRVDKMMDPPLPDVQASDEDDVSLEMLRQEKARAEQLAQEVAQDTIVQDSANLIRSIDAESNEPEPEPWHLQDTKFRKWPEKDMSRRVAKEVKKHLVRVAEETRKERERRGALYTSMRQKEISIDLTREQVVATISALNKRGKMVRDEGSMSTSESDVLLCGDSKASGLNMLANEGDGGAGGGHHLKIPHAPAEKRNAHRQPFAHLQRVNPLVPGKSPLILFRELQKKKV